MNSPVRNSLLAAMLLFWLSGPVLSQPQDAGPAAEETRAEENASQAEEQQAEEQPADENQGAGSPAPESQDISVQDGQDGQNRENRDNQEQNPDAALESTEGDESPGRFIPSEQISQDLGVSFPSDI